MSGKKKALLVVLFILLLLASVVFVAGYMFFNPVNSGPSPAGKHYKNKPITKSEMVYVDTDPSGKPQSVVVDAYLRNNTENKIITDKTNLTDIVNINGNEQFKRSGNGTITWPANGNDIYYEGIAEKGDVPITMKVTYYLDGKKSKEKIWKARVAT